MREEIDGFGVDPDDVVWFETEEELNRWARTRRNFLPIGRKVDPDDPATLIWNPTVTVTETPSPDLT